VAQQKHCVSVISTVVSQPLLQCFSNKWDNHQSINQSINQSKLFLTRAMSCTSSNLRRIKTNKLTITTAKTTTTTTTTVLRPFVWEYPGEPVPEETFTHSHLFQSSIILYLLPPSIVIYGILPVQFTWLTAFFHNLSPSFLWSTSWSGTLHFILHTFLHSIIVFFLQRMTIPSQPVLL